MTGRVARIVGLITPCGLLADVGCDHGLVAAGALEKDVKRVIAADIRPSSLEKAKRLLRGKPNVAFVVSDGFDGIAERVDEAVLTGLGGRNIVSILSRIDYRPDLVLGPQHCCAEVRRFLVENGWKIVHDECFSERGKFYDLMRAEAGEGERLDPVQSEYGVFYKIANAALRLKAEARLKRLSSFAPSPGTDARIKAVKEVLAWQRQRT